MNRLYSFSMTLIATSVLAVGCASEGAPGEAASLDPLEIVDQEAVLPFPSHIEPTVARSSDVIVGAEGLRIAIDKVRNDLEVLHRQADAKPSAIAQQEANLAVLEDAARRIGTQPAAPQAVSCSIFPMVTPSSSLGFRIGIFAGYQAVCSGGCMAITTTASACTDQIPCSPPFAQTHVVCDTPALHGIVLPGSQSGPCAGTASVNPPNVTVTNFIPCG